MPPGERRVPVEGAIAHLRTPFPILRDVALDDRHLHRRAGRPRPFDARERGARPPQCRRAAEQRERPPITAEQGPGECAGHERGDSAGAVHPGHRQPPRRGGVDLCIPDLKPGESGERPSAHPLAQHPGRRVHREQARRIPSPLSRGSVETGRRDAGHDPADRGRVEREASDEPRRQHEPQGVGDVAEGETFADPRRAGAERPEPEQPAAKAGAPRGAAIPPREEQRGEGRERDGEQAERRKRERQGGAGRHAYDIDGGPARPHPHHHPHLAARPGFRRIFRFSPAHPRGRPAAPAAGGSGACRRGPR